MNANQETKVRMLALIAKINEADTAYYKHDNPIMTDREYDLLMEQLLDLEAQTGLVISGSPTQRVAGDILEELEEVRHTKPMKPPVKDNADQLMMGHLLEPIAAYWYQQKSGNLVQEDTILYQHADHPYALANFDRRYTRTVDGKPGILECKSCTYHKADSWADDAIPLYYEFQLRYYLAVADVNHGAFSCFWGNNPENDLAMPEIERDSTKEDMIFERLDEWIWSLEHDVPPTMSGVKPELALNSLARIYGASCAGLPTIEFPGKFESSLRRIALLQGKISECSSEIKKYEEEVQAHSVRIAELMKQHEHGVLETTKDKLLVDFVTRKTKRPDSKMLREKYPTVYGDVIKESQSRKVKVTVQSA